MSNKTKKLLKWIPSILVALQLTVSAVLMFTGFPLLQQLLQRTGLAEYSVLFACAEILFAALFLFPPTMRVGFMLLTAYFGGAIATELSYGNTIAPLAVLTVLWIAAYLRKPEIFTGENINTSATSTQQKVAA